MFKCVAYVITGLVVGTFPISQSAAQMIPPQALRADVDLAYDALKQGSPGLYRFRPKTDVDRAFLQARQSIRAPMTSLDFYRILAPAIASIQNGHTSFSAPAESWEAVRNEPLLPLGLRIIDNRAFVFRDFSGRAGLVGHEVMEINGRKVSDILAQMSRSTSLDGIVASSRDRNNSGWGFIYNLSLIADVHAPYSVLLRHGPRTGRFTLGGLVAGDIRKAWEVFPTDREAMRPRKSELRFDNNVAILTVAHWDYVEDGKPSMIDDIRAWFRKISERSPKALIIDIRSNSGGDETVATAMLTHLLGRPFTQYRCIGVNGTDFPFLTAVNDALEYRKNLRDYTLPALSSCRSLAPLRLTNRPNIGAQNPVDPVYRGKLIVLTDGGSFSTSAEFAAMIRSHRRGTLIGAETSGSYYGSDSGIMIPLTLPASRTQLDVPTISYWLNVQKGVPRERGVIPHRRIVETIEDMVAGRDRVMAEALRMAR